MVYTLDDNNKLNKRVLRVDQSGVWVYGNSREFIASTEEQRKLLMNNIKRLESFYKIDKHTRAVYKLLSAGLDKITAPKLTQAAGYANISALMQDTEDDKRLFKANYNGSTVSERVKKNKQGYKEYTAVSSPESVSVSDSEDSLSSGKTNASFL